LIHSSLPGETQVLSWSDGIWEIRYCPEWREVKKNGRSNHLNGETTVFFRIAVMSGVTRLLLFPVL
jgi:hypothetical protein